MGRRAIGIAAAALAVTAGAANVAAVASAADRACTDDDSHLLPVQPGRRVRPRDDLARVLVTEGTEHSATFAALMAALEQSDVVVYVDAELRIGNGPSGRLHFLGAGGGLRYVYVQVDAGSTSWAMAIQRQHDLIAILGHELQHATEIAAAPVDDVAGFVRLYHSIGAYVRGSAVDTAAAREAGQQVLAELLGGDSGPAACDDSATR